MTRHRRSCGTVSVTLPCPVCGEGTEGEGEGEVTIEIEWERQTQVNPGYCSVYDMTVECGCILTAQQVEVLEQRAVERMDDYDEVEEREDYDE